MQHFSQVCHVKTKSRQFKLEYKSEKKTFPKCRSTIRRRFANEEDRTAARARHPHRRIRSLLRHPAETRSNRLPTEIRSLRPIIFRGPTEIRSLVRINFRGPTEIRSLIRCPDRTRSRGRSSPTACSARATESRRNFSTATPSRMTT